MFERILKDFVNKLDQEKSGGFHKLGMIIGNSATSTARDRDAIWRRMENVFGNDDIALQTIQRTLGTLLMIILAEDPRYWIWESDPEKELKKSNGEKPEGNIYYRDNKKINYTIEELSKKFKIGL